MTRGKLSNAECSPYKNSLSGNCRAVPGNWIKHYRKFCVYKDLISTCLLFPWVSPFSWLIQMLFDDNMLPGTCLLLTPLWLSCGVDSIFRCSLPIWILAYQTPLWQCSLVLVWIYLLNLLHKSLLVCWSDSSVLCHSIKDRVRLCHQRSRRFKFNHFTLQNLIRKWTCCKTEKMKMGFKYVSSDAVLFCDS